MNALDVSVVVVSWNTRDLTLACLKSLEVETANSRTTVETVVVDNASTDGTVEAIRREYPDARVVACDTNTGFAAGCNRAIPMVKGRYILLLNPDAELACGALDRMTGFLDATPKAAAVGASLVSPDGEPQFSCGRFLTPLNQFAETIGIGARLPFRALRRSYAQHELIETAVEVDWVVGACLALRREALERVGPLDERFFMYSEDEDLCYRLRLDGWSVWLLPHMRVRHVGGGAAVQALDRMRAEARMSQAAFIRKHHGRAAEFLFRTLMRVASLKPTRRSQSVGWGR